MDFRLWAICDVPQIPIARPQDLQIHRHGKSSMAARLMRALSLRTEQFSTSTFCRECAPRLPGRVIRLHAPSVCLSDTRRHRLNGASPITEFRAKGKSSRYRLALSTLSPARSPNTVKNCVPTSRRQMGGGTLRHTDDYCFWGAAAAASALPEAGIAGTICQPVGHDET
jgi:hypothetical protein